MHVRVYATECTPTQAPPRGMPRLLWDFSRAHFPSTDSGEGLAETVGGDKIAM